MRTAQRTAQIALQATDKDFATTAQICVACMLWHIPPIPCDHDASKPCLSCNQPRGYRWNNVNQQPAAPMRQCWHCWWAEQPPGTVQ